MTPEQKARQRIDPVREFPLKGGMADYLLDADCKAIGVIEAKPGGHNLTGVETQSGKYLDGLPPGLPHYQLPLPFACESTGTITHFTNTLDPDARSREVFIFHRPEELIRLARLDCQTRSLLRQMPELKTERLWRVQIDSIKNLEASLADSRPRSLIQMATGSGKTYLLREQEGRFAEGQSREQHMARGLCIVCGRPLGIWNKLFGRKQHRACGGNQCWSGLTGY
jgi:type I site-specific restriction endonuclease